MSTPVRYARSDNPYLPAVTVHHGSCLDVLRGMPANSVHAVVTDPPYGLSDHTPAKVIQALTAWASGDRERVPDGRGFMGAAWDRFVPPPAVWDECLRVLRPGGHLAVFAGARTADLMGLSIRLAGFEIRDTITWLYASGLPKGLNISKAIDKAAGAEREVVGKRTDGRYAYDFSMKASRSGGIMGTDALQESRGVVTNPATDAAKQWNGWNVALKPASEPIIIARKPFPGTVAANVQRYGTGGMNIDACRVLGAGQDYYDKCASVVGLASNRNGDCYGEWTGARVDSSSPQGRWPANVVLSHASTPEGEDLCGDGCIDGCPVLELDRESGERPTGSVKAYMRASRDWYSGDFPAVSTYTKAADSGGASRFFNVFRYQAKAPKPERPVCNGRAHPTVKPLALVEHLVTLFTPPEGMVLDLFAGTGTLGQAAHRLGFDSILIEEDGQWLPHIDLRLTRYLRGAA